MNPVAGIIWILFMLTILAGAILIPVFWIYCIVDVLKSKFENNDKLIWMLLVLFTGPIGGIIYLTIGRKQKIKDKQPYEPTPNAPTVQTIPQNSPRKEKICTAPGCYGVMQIRTAKDGKNYWVCSEYNKCKTAVAVEEAGA